MKWNTWILCALALALAVAVAAMVSREKRTTPAEFLASVEARISDGRYDREQAVQNLDAALERAVDAGDTALAARIHLLRGRTLMDLGAFDRARVDLMAVAAASPGELSVEDDLVELEARSGDFHAAVERVKRRLLAQPESGPAWVTLGRLHRAAADKGLARVGTVLDRALVPEDAARARALCERSAMLDAGDARRVAIAGRLRELLSSAEEGRLEEVLNTLDAASRDVTAARDAWSRSIQFGLATEAVSGLFDLYDRAGYTTQAVDLATATLRLEAVRNDAQIGQLLIRTLTRIGRGRYASELALIWIGKTVPPRAEFVIDCCEALRLAQRWDGLVRASNVLRGVGDAVQIGAANLYLGLALVEQQQWADGWFYLQLYASTTDPAPFAGARALMWRAMARASKELGKAAQERAALQGALDLEPEHDGEAWLRLAELQVASPNAGYRGPEMRFAKGMSLLPARTEELRARWDEIGALELKSIGLDLEAVRQDLVHNRIWTPASDASPYELYRLAQIHADASDWLRASAHVKRLLEIVPGFVPALDLAIDIAGKMGRKRERTDLALERLRRAGRSPAITEILRDVGIEDIEPRDLLSMMRADPEHIGRLAVATSLGARGSRDRAIALLEGLGDDSLGDEGRLLFGRLLLEVGDARRALDRLQPIGLGLRSQPMGIETYVRAALASGARERLLALVTKLAETAPGARDGASPSAPSGAPLAPAERMRWLRLVDLCFLAGEPAAARPLLARLDSEPKLRGGDVVLRLAGLAMLEGRPADVRAALDRAQAFETLGGFEFQSLLAAAFDNRTEDFRGLASRIAAAGARKLPLYEAELEILQEKPEVALPVLEAGLKATFRRDPQWNLCAAAARALATPNSPFEPAAYLGQAAARETALFVRGPDGRRDPRAAVALLVALREPLGAAFARAALTRMTPESHGRLWPGWLSSMLASAPGMEVAARSAAESTLAAFADFGPAWDVLDRLARTDEEARDVWRRRRAALVDQAGSKAERMLDDARAMQEAGDLEAALAEATRAQAEDFYSIAARRKVGELHSLLGHEAQAIAAYRDALRARPAEDGLPRVPELPGERTADLTLDFLDALARVRENPASTLPRERLDNLHTELCRLRPHDPRVFVAAAEVDLRADPQNPSLGVARAYARLDAFRAGHKGRSFEGLARGSVRAWSQFYARLDPSRAREFVEEQLALEPGVISTWIDLARVSAAERDYPRARRELEHALRLAPDGSVLREILRLRSESELAAEEIDSSIHAVIQAEGKGTADAELMWLSARCFLNLGPRYHAHTIEQVDSLNPWHAMNRSFQVRHGLLAATARCARARGQDLAEARAMLEEIEPLLTDPYQRNFVTALAGLTRIETRPARVE